MAKLGDLDCASAVTEMLRSHSELTTSDVERATLYSTGAARRALEKLRAEGLVTLRKRAVQMEAWAGRKRRLVINVYRPTELFLSQAAS